MNGQQLAPALAALFVLLCATAPGVVAECSISLVAGIAQVSCSGDIFYASPSLSEVMYSPEVDAARSVVLTYTGPFTDTYDANLLLWETLNSASASKPAILRLVGVNMIGQQVHLEDSFAGALTFNPSLTLELENCIISKTQISFWGAFAVRGDLGVSVRLINTQLLDNQLIMALGGAVGGNTSLELFLVDSTISGNTVAAVGALAGGVSASLTAEGTGGSVDRNLVAGAALLATAGPSEASADMSDIPANDNTLLGAGAPLTDLPVVRNIIQAVMNAVYVDDSTLGSDLDVIQGQLCADLEPDSRIGELLYNLNLVDVGGIVDNLMCGPDPKFKLSDVLGMLSGGNNEDGGSSFRSVANSVMALKSLALGDSQVKLKSFIGLLKALMHHPSTLSAIPDLLKALVVVPAN